MRSEVIRDKKYSKYRKFCISGIHMTTYLCPLTHQQLHLTDYRFEVKAKLGSIELSTKAVYWKADLTRHYQINFPRIHPPRSMNSTPGQQPQGLAVHQSASDIAVMNSNPVVVIPHLRYQSISIFVLVKAPITF